MKCSRARTLRLFRLRFWGLPVGFLMGLFRSFVRRVESLWQLIRCQRSNNFFLHLHREVSQGDSDGAAKRDQFHQVHAALARLTLGNVGLGLLQTLRQRSLRQPSPFARLDEQTQKRLVFGRVQGRGLRDNSHPTHEGADAARKG